MGGAKAVDAFMQKRYPAMKVEHSIAEKSNETGSVLQSSMEGIQLNMENR